MNYWTENGNMPAETNRSAKDLRSDKRLIKQDIMSGIAHATMLGKQGIVPLDETRELQETLTRIFYDVTSGELIPDDCSVADFLDKEVAARVGKETAEKLSIARSFDDRMTLDLRMYVLEMCDGLSAGLKALAEALLSLAEAHTRTIMPLPFGAGKGLPTTLAHVLAGFTEPLMRDIDRINSARKAAEVMTLYSGYGTGVTYDIDRAQVAQLLGMKAASANSLDALTDNDFIAEYSAAVLVLSRHLAAIAGALSGFARRETPFINFDMDTIIPSPVSPTRIGKTVFDELCASFGGVAATAQFALGGSFMRRGGRDYSAAVNVLYSTESETVMGMETITEAVNYVAAHPGAVNVAAMKAAAQTGFPTALACEEFLISSGLTRSEAHKTVGALCDYCIEHGKRLDALPLDVYAEFSEHFTEDAVRALRIKEAVRRMRHDGEPGDMPVKAEIRKLKKKLFKRFPAEE